MSLVRSRSNSMSSASSHDSASDSPAASDHEGPYSRSTSPEGDGSNNNGAANSAGEAPIADEHPDSDNPTVTVPDSDDMESRKAGSDEDGSTSPRSHNSSESEVEVVTIWKTARTKKMPKSTSTIRDAKTYAPGPTQPISDVDKVSEMELRNQRHQDTRLLDKNFGAWHDQKISEGCNGWKKCTKMRCDHGEAHKELPHQDPIGPPLDYMKARRVFKARKTNAFDLCHFYRMRASREFPTLPTPCEPASHDMLKWLLETAWAVKHAHLLIAFAGDSTMTICLL